MEANVTFPSITIQIIVRSVILQPKSRGIWKDIYFPKTRTAVIVISRLSSDVLD